MSRILIVEDEVHLAEGLRFNLQSDGHDVTVTATGEDALRRMLDAKEDFDAVILDVMLPGKDGFTVTTELRNASHFVPILILTARGRSEDVLKGFESGADDYLPKPFELSILLARLTSLLRRREWLRAAVQSDTNSEDRSDIFRFNGKSVDFERLQLHVGPQVFQLTLMESELLRYFVRNSGKPVTRKSILENVWNLREDTDTRAIDNFVVRLRRYIEDNPAKPRHLLTVRGLGYQFVAEPK